MQLAGWFLQALNDETHEWRNFGKVDEKKYIERDLKQMEWIEPCFGWRMALFSNDKIISIGKTNYKEKEVKIDYVDSM